MQLSLILLVSFLKVIATIFIEDSCKTGLISGSTDFKDATFPSLARIVYFKTKSFICNAVILTKNQLLTGR